jgi:hypothetical protein
MILSSRPQTVWACCRSSNLIDCYKSLESFYRNLASSVCGPFLSTNCKYVHVNWNCLLSWINHWTCAPLNEEIQTFANECWSSIEKGTSNFKHHLKQYKWHCYIASRVRVAWNWDTTIHINKISLFPASVTTGVASYIYIQTCCCI